MPDDLFASIRAAADALVASIDEPPPRESWQIRRAEILCILGSDKQAQRLIDLHRDFVRLAVLEGKPVPAEVRKDYNL